MSSIMSSMVRGFIRTIKLCNNHTYNSKYNVAAAFGF